MGSCAINERVPDSSSGNKFHSNRRLLHGADVDRGGKVGIYNNLIQVLHELFLEMEDSNYQSIS